MTTKSNSVSILRKRVVDNIPGFDDDETGNPQNEWLKLYDIECVDFCPAATAKVFDMEHSANYDNNDTSHYMEFYFESARQKNTPPYDIQVGDYVAYYQQGQKHFCRIAKITNVQMFVSCCVYELICNITNPRESETLLSCGLLTPIPNKEVNNG